MIKKLMNILMISCKKATELIEKKFVVDLTFKEKVELNIHTSMCNACRNYKEQSAIIDKALHQYDEEEPHEKSKPAPEELKQKIHSKIENL